MSLWHVVREAATEMRPRLAAAVLAGRGGSSGTKERKKEGKKETERKRNKKKEEKGLLRHLLRTTGAVNLARAGEKMAGFANSDWDLHPVNPLLCKKC